MAKRKTLPLGREIQKLDEENKLIIGTEETLKKLKQGKVSKVYLSSNVDKETEESIDYYCKVFNVEVQKLTQNNEEIGVMCRKPFNISVLSVQ